MPNLFSRYADWLHLRWPAGSVEKLPEVNSDGTTAVPGVRVVGDLTGVPLLKFAADSGARAVQAIAAELGSAKAGADASDGPADLAIVGGGVAGLSAALEAKKLGLRFVVFEAAQPFATIANFPKGKPIFTYPTDMRPAGDLALTADVKEDLLAELEAQRRAADIEPRRARIERIERQGDLLLLHHPDGQPFRARRVIVAIGRSGNHRKLGVPGEDLDKVSNRLHDPAAFAGQNVLVVGGGDSALEAATALAKAGASVTLSYRGKAFARAKPENVDALAPADVSVVLDSTVRAIAADSITLKTPSGETPLPNDAVFSLIGREAPLDFFRRSGIPIQGETSLVGWLGVAALLLFCVFVYSWKGGGPTESWINPSAWADSLRETASDRTTLLGTLAVSMKSRSFYYTLIYSLAIFAFGLDRMRRRRTPYVKRQTWTLMAVQWLPLFILPEIILPWAGYNGLFSSGLGALIGDNLFESYISAADYAAAAWPDWGHPRAYWRAYGFILAWPLNVYNVFTDSPHWWWIGIGAVQTFVLIPLAIWRWGKGAYCGWVCSCGALAETMGDRHRHKMPHGPFWNKLNFIGQAFLAAAFALLAVRVVGWIFPGSWADRSFHLLLEGKDSGGQLTAGFAFSYKWFVDVLFGGILGVGLYFKYSGRVWCRFACPLAALMHIYARFSRFRIFADKKKCISCNVCTSVCHQGIDIMSFANKGLPMEDPECVRCSACVQSCPTGVLTFGQLLASGQPLFDSLPASPVQMQEKRLAQTPAAAAR
ncbi:MAG: NAD(P)-binding domain-containing protein [Candidatus Didemnitutus sp.]|nr:NAD(P)-binding domain-containing protein [Candidatus Didemnitutus sp.]